MMKNINSAYILFISLFLFTYSCSDSGEDLKFSPTEELGWVEFIETESDPQLVQVFQGSNISTIDLDVNIQVPTTSTDLIINYDMSSISGPNPNTVFSNNGSIVAPAGSTSYAGPDNNTGIDYTYLANLTFNLDELSNVVLTEPMVFDVTLVSTSSDIITAGIDGESSPLTKRIEIYPNLENFVGTYSVAEQFTDGVNAPLGLSNFFAESYQIELQRAENDATGSKFVISNSQGFDVYFEDGVELSFGFDGSLSFEGGNSEDGFPLVALFRIFQFETSSYNYDSLVLQANGPLDTFGAYQFVLTKQQ